MRYILIILLLFNVGLAQSLFGVVASDGGLDVDAKKFIQATGITDGTQKRAINYLCKSLKDSSLWTKMTVIYPMVGGTSTAHAYNLKDTGSNKLTFFNSPTHNSNGVSWNGSNQYASGLPVVPNFNSSHLSYYTKTNSTSPVNQVPIGALNSFSPVPLFQLNISAANGGIGDASTVASFTNTDTRGFYVVSRTSSTNMFVNKNGSTVATNTSTNTTTSIAFAPFLGARNDNNGTVNFYSTHQCAFSSVGTALTSAEATTYYNIIQQYQTILGRQN